jgi:hypothetical protein
MKACARCTAVAPDTTLKCPQCGSLLVAPPAPVAPAPDAAPAAGAISVEEQFFAPVAVRTLAPPQLERSTPRAPQPAPRPKRSLWSLVAAILVIGGLGGAVYGIVHASGGGRRAAKTPVILTPNDPSAGLPGGLEQAVRIQAESSRQVAFSAITEAWSATDGQFDVRTLAQMQPGLKWLAADASSTGPHEVSLGRNGETVTVAISASSKDVCAFGRLTPGSAGQYVTMGNVSSCRAVDAPTAGWSNLRGGSASDLPADGY